jgi:hypothetical protein
MTQRQHEIDDMRAVAWKSNGTPTKFEIVQSSEPRPRPRIIGADDDIQHIVSPVPAERSRVQYVITGNPIDEARAFNHRTNNLALIIACGSILLAVWFGAGLTAFTGIMAFGAIYAVCWLIAYLVDILRSPGGIELFHAWHLWSFLRREQDHRHRAGRDGDGWWKVLFVVLAGMAGLWLILIVMAAAQLWMPQ